MQCPMQARENADLLLAYCSRKLEPQTAHILERHMESCAECGAFGEAQRAVWAALSAWEVQPISSTFDRRLYGRIEAEEQRGWWNRAVRPWLPRALRPAFPLAAASVLVAAVLLMQSPGPEGAPAEFVGLSSGPSGPGAADVVEMDLERVESTLEDLEMLHQLNLMARAEPASFQAM